MRYTHFCWLLGSKRRPSCGSGRRPGGPRPQPIHSKGRRHPHHGAKHEQFRNLFIDDARHCSTDRVIEVSAWRRARVIAASAVMKERRWSRRPSCGRIDDETAPIEPHSRAARAAPSTLSEGSGCAFLPAGAPLAKFNIFKDGSSVRPKALAGISFRARSHERGPPRGL